MIKSNPFLGRPQNRNNFIHNDIRILLHHPRIQHYSFSCWVVSHGLRGAQLRMLSVAASTMAVAHRRHEPASRRTTIHLFFHPNAASL